MPVVELRDDAFERIEHVSVRAGIEISRRQGSRSMKHYKLTCEIAGGVMLAQQKFDLAGDVKNFAFAMRFDREPMHRGNSTLITIEAS